MTENTEKDSLTDLILQVTSDQKPQTVDQLLELVMKISAKDKETLEERTEYVAKRKQVLATIMKLQEQGKLQLTPISPPAATFSAYLKTSSAAWFWTVIALAASTLLAVFLIPSTSFPLVYLRYALGVIFLLWLPGYSLTKALFPENYLNFANTQNFDAVERAALSIGTSLAIVPMIGLLLNYTPWGITLTSTVSGLIALTIVLAFGAAFRQYHTGKKQA